MLLKISTLTSFLITVLVSCPFWGFVPNSTFVVKKLVENNGSGSFDLEQDLTFVFGAETLQIKEIWSIETENRVSLKATGPGVDILIRYKNKVREGSDTNLANAFESLYLSRYDESLFAYFAKNNLPLAKDKDPRLSRAGGYVAYTWGGIQSDDTAIKEKPTGVWVEQDAFVVRKIRLPNGNEMIADHFQKNGKSPWIAKDRIYKWNENETVIRTVAIQSRPVSKNLKPDTAPLRAEILIEKPELKKQVVEFYQRFR